jgi:hypothetical protein
MDTCLMAHRAFTVCRSLLAQAFTNWLNKHQHGSACVGVVIWLESVGCLEMQHHPNLKRDWLVFVGTSKASMKPHLILLPLGVSNAMCIRGNFIFSRIVDRQCIFDLLGCWHRGGFDSHFPQPSV